MSFFDQPIDRREMAYGRLALSTLETLREVVAKRESEGETRAEIARRIGMDRSQLSRTLNGKVKNITLRTISDILFSTGHSVASLDARPWEAVTQSWNRNGPVGNINDIIINPHKSTIIKLNPPKTWTIPSRCEDAFSKPGTISKPSFSTNLSAVSE